MICPHCGAEVEDGVKYCPVCGSAMSVEQAATPGTADQGVAPGTGNQSFGSGAPNQGSVSNAADQAQPAPGQYPVVPAAPVAQKGCLGQGWSDITSSPDWVKLVLPLMVMRAIPVIRFFSSGYNLKWGVAAAKGDNSLLQKGTFGKLEAKAGFFYVVLTWLFNIAVAGVSLLVMGIPVLGAIVMVAAGIVLNAITFAAALRMAMFDKFGEAFELSDLVAAFKRKPGQLILASYIPALIVGAIASVLMAIVLGANFSDIFSELAYSSSYSSYGYGSSILGVSSIIDLVFELLGVIGVAGSLVLLVASLLQGFAELWSMRAVGIWVQRYVPEWSKGEKVADAVFGNPGAPSAPAGTPDASTYPGSQAGSFASTPGTGSTFNG